MTRLAASRDADLWIDCTDSDEEGVWVCSEDSATGVSYRNWTPDEPNNYPGNRDGSGADFARLLPTGSWRDTNNRLLHSVCEMEPTCMQCCTITAENECH